MGQMILYKQISTLIHYPQDQIFQGTTSVKVISSESPSIVFEFDDDLSVQPIAIIDEDYFIQQFEKCIDKLDDDVKIDNKLVADMREQGKQIMPEIQDALDDYFEEYEVLAVEMPLMETMVDKKITSLMDLLMPSSQHQTAKFIFLIGRRVHGDGT